MSDIVFEAEKLARKAHESQLRIGGAPYIVHPERVAGLLINSGFDDLTIAAGWLHDTLEDTQISENELYSLNPELLEIIKAVTEDSSLLWVERKKQFTDCLRNASDRAKAVACADRIDNLTDFLNEYEKVGLKLWDRWPERTPQEKLHSDQYFLQMLKETWNHVLVRELEKLIVKELEIL